MTRRTRRRLCGLGLITVAGALLPLWLPPFLAVLPVFRVERIEVVGAGYVPPDEILRLAAVDSTASVWDDPGVWEERIRNHPLVQQARISRRGFRTLEVRVVEDRPVALAATPALVPVNGEGRVLPLDPAETRLDLPVLGGPARVRHEPTGPRVDAGHRRMAAALAELEAYNPAFTQLVSEVVLRGDGSMELRMLEGAHCRRILLRPDSPVEGLRRIELALGSATGPALSADARFAGQVVLRSEGGT